MTARCSVSSIPHSSLDLFSNFTYVLANPDQGDQFNQSERCNMAGVNVAQSWVSTIGGHDMRKKIGLQTLFDRLSPVGIYDAVAHVAVGRPSGGRLCASRKPSSTPGGQSPGSPRMPWINRSKPSLRAISLTSSIGAAGGVFMSILFKRVSLSYEK
jgi:hypothetical protein